MVITKKQQNTARLELGVFLGVLTALWLSGNADAGGRDSLTLSAGQWLTVVLHAVCLPLAAFGIGSFVHNLARLDSPVPVRLATGSAVLSLLAGAIGMLGWLRRPEVQILAQILIAIFATQSVLVLCSRDSIGAARQGLQSHTLAIVLIAVVLAVKCALLLQPDMHPDALWYNLTAARQWFLAGAVHFTPTAIASAQSSFWEYLYLWPQLLSGVETGGSQLALHLTAQLLHFVLGHCGVLWCVLVLVAAALPVKTVAGDRAADASERSAALLLAAVAVLVSRELFYTAYTAKNDWGVAFWWLAGAVVALSGRSKRNAFAGGMLLGMAAGGKFTYIVPSLAILIVQGVQVVKGMRPVNTVLWVGSGLAAPLAVVLARNFIWTGNPIFPAMAALFPDSVMPPVWHAAMTEFQGQPGQTAGWTLEGFFPLSQMLAFGSLLPATLSPLQSRYRLLTLGLEGLRGTLFAAIVLFLLVSSTRTEARLIGIVPVLLLVLGGLAAVVWLHQRPLPQQLRRAVVWCLALGTLLSAEFDLRRFSQILQPGATRRIITEAPGGLAYSYLAEQPDRDKIFLLHNTELYYFLPWQVSRVWDDLTIQAAQQRRRSAHDLICELADKGRWLLLTPRAIDNFFDARVVEEVTDTARTHQIATAVFRPGERLVDLKRLTAALGTCGLEH